MHLEQMSTLMLLMWSLVCSCSAHPSRIKICGSQLTDALKLACGPGGYNPPYWDEAFPLTEKDAAAALLARARRPRGPGVATECCYNGCTWRTIVTYCADPVHGMTKKSTDEVNFGEVSFEGAGQDAQRIARLSGGGPEMDLDNMRRSEPVFGTVSPEYMRFPRTLDEVPVPYPGMQGV